MWHWFIQTRFTGTPRLIGWKPRLYDIIVFTDVKNNERKRIRYSNQSRPEAYHLLCYRKTHYAHFSSSTLSFNIHPISHHSYYDVFPDDSKTTCKSFHICVFHSLTSTLWRCSRDFVFPADASEMWDVAFECLRDHENFLSPVAISGVEIQKFWEELK